MLRRMRAVKSGCIFTPAQFLDLGTRAGIDQALSRLSRAGKIRRAGRGLYDIPRTHPWIGTLSPALAGMTTALAARTGLELRPTGAEAANMLGLSEQVPGKTVFLTSGRSRKLMLGDQPIELRKRSSRFMAMSARPMGLIVSAMQSIGKTHLTTERLTELRGKLSDKDQRIILDELPLAPAWMHPFLRYLATGRTTL